MGMFDRFWVGEREFQCKAFGKLLHDFHLGEEVTLHRAPFTQEDYEKSYRGEFKPPPNTYSDYQVECSEDNLYITIKANKFTGVEVRDLTLPCFNYFGELTEVP